MIRKQVLTRRQKWFPHRRPDPGVVAVLQLARELRVVPVDVQQHEVAVVPFRSLRHALRGRGAIGALKIQLFREGGTACGATGAGGGSAQRNHGLKVPTGLAQGSSTLLPERQERRCAPCVARVWVAAGAVFPWLAAADMRDFGRAALQFRAGPSAISQNARPRHRHRPRGSSRHTSARTASSCASCWPRPSG